MSQISSPALQARMAIPPQSPPQSQPPSPGEPLAPHAPNFQPIGFVLCLADTPRPAFADDVGAMLLTLRGDSTLPEQWQKTVREDRNIWRIYGHDCQIAVEPAHLISDRDFELMWILGLREAIPTIYSTCVAAQNVGGVQRWTWQAPQNVKPTPVTIRIMDTHGRAPPAGLRRLQSNAVKNCIIC